MVGGPALRFVLEAAFLIVLAIAAGLAELSPMTIVLVMAGGWLLVAAIEWLAWRESPTTVTRVVREPEAAQEPEPAEATPPTEEAAKGRRFWRRKTTAAEPSGDDTQDLGPPPEPEAVLRGEQRDRTA